MDKREGLFPISVQLTPQCQALLEIGLADLGVFARTSELTEKETGRPKSSGARVLTFPVVCIQSKLRPKFRFPEMPVVEPEFRQGAAQPQPGLYAAAAADRAVERQAYVVVLVSRSFQPLCIASGLERLFGKFKKVP